MEPCLRGTCGRSVGCVIDRCFGRGWDEDGDGDGDGDGDYSGLSFYSY